ncbi:hypothetical protein V501_05115 [Pseudogymnoascus sp. VKM F-4519 (FW-2642)]|nr:hypothetical protein V501_05115 [Pseudogymnoascus sp. VKM F-4519 (FW-2642)]
MPDTNSQRLGQYGTVPLDFFILEKWDFSLPVTKDLQQWERLTKEYLALTALQRFPYHQPAWARADMSRSELEANLPSNGEIDRALRPFQTRSERLISAQPPGQTEPLWLRTCYDPSLAYAYEDMFSDCYVGDSSGIPAKCVMDEVGLYDWPGPDGWQNILTRIPGLCDVVQGSVEEDYEFEDEEYQHEGEEENEALGLASFKSRVLIYVLDEEALRQKLVKMMWLDIHGNCVWRSKIKPDEVRDFGGGLKDGKTLADSIERLEDFDGAKGEVCCGMGRSAELPAVPRTYGVPGMRLK